MENNVAQGSQGLEKGARSPSSPHVSMDRAQCFLCPSSSLPWWRRLASSSGQVHLISRSTWNTAPEAEKRGPLPHFFNYNGKHPVNNNNLIEHYLNACHCFNFFCLKFLTLRFFVYSCNAYYSLKRQIILSSVY